MCIPTIAFGSDTDDRHDRASQAASITQWSKIDTRGPAHGKARIQLLAQGDNAFVGRLWLAPGAQVPLHHDISEEYIIFLSGGGAITIDGVTTRVQAGSTVFMPAKAKVSFVNGPNDTYAIQIFSGPESAQKYQSWPIISRP